MARAKYQVLVIPYRVNADGVRYCVFKRSDMNIWQFISGGGEDEDACVTASAKREAFEEAGIPEHWEYVRLDTCCSIPACCFGNYEERWGKDCFVVPEYAFGVKAESVSMVLSHEHTAFEWVDYETARSMLKYDSNRTALWELSRRIELGIL